MTSAPHRSIGEVVELLTGEFDDITISKVRFLESRGLVEPERAASGYRRYRDRDVAQLRWVLRQQRDQFLPLKVIRERLSTGRFDAEVQLEDGDDQGARAPIDVAPVDPLLPPDTRLELTGRELAERTGLTTDDLAAMERYGLLMPQQRRGRPVYSGDDLLATQLMARFLDHGVEPRHLRPFKVAAEREAGVIGQRLAALSGAAADDALAELLHLGAQLRALLLRRLVH